MTKNAIEKQIEINAPRRKVWQALTKAEKFGQWFCVDFRGHEFEAGKPIVGQTTYPGYEHIVSTFNIKDIKPETYFSMTWHPYAIDMDKDYSSEIPTLVEYELSDLGDGTLLKVKESGFDNLPSARRDEAFKMNEGGWEEQLQNIKRYVCGQ